ncbi:YhdP family protein [Chromobacterium sp. IIBBL 290-4]|uniref:YhdP family protein n=1 Tax=Chromobacterium sp. IIBBL 290-4 TaxID=2953890 RepID=UPI0020B865E6|nr:YhdP family protein [Chromobacterium sp. IIBBL 290-4]UTH73298.1 TIGR02099 family protein [Chromobacterium sp. IIBBL 290-4]
MKKPLSLLSHIHVLRVLKRGLLFLAVVAGLTVVLLSAAFAGFTFWLLPNLDQYRPRLESELTAALGHKVSIARLAGHWEDVGPQFDLQGVSIANPASGQALTLSAVSIQPSWTSLLAWEPRLVVRVEGPAVELRRTADNIVLLNGFDISSGPSSDNALGDWLLRQPVLEIRNASLGWQDDRLGLPRLDLKQGRLLLERGLLGHRLQLSGLPAATLGKGFELSASWRGGGIQHWQQWSGSIKVALNGARADVWSRYLRQMGALRSGEGDGTLEMSFADGAVRSLSADVNVRNAAYTPPSSRELVLPQLQGKLQLDRESDGSYRIAASDLTLASVTGLAFDKSSIKGRWLPGAKGEGELTLDNVDVGHLTPFIHALGVDANPLFARFSPQGELHQVTLSWKGPAESPRSYQLASRFHQLGWQPFDDLPGVSGVSGSIAFSEAGGSLKLDSGKGEVVYPAVFAQTLAFDHLGADVAWTQGGKGLEIAFKRVDFSNADLNGKLDGVYRYSGSGAGAVDLNAAVDSVKAERVPAYLPHQVGEHTMRWLRQALRDGRANNVKMKLAGDLEQFPFEGGKGGLFQVEADVEGVRLAYQPGWPTIDDIDAKLVFHNETMRVEGKRASTLGVPLRNVVAEIDKLGADAPLLTIDGGADDELARMLDFTVKSPVDGWLGGFTGGVKADGKAALKLHLAIPLAGEEPVRVRGDIDFRRNKLQFIHLPLPELDQAQGRLTFTERGVDSNGVSLHAFGGPFHLSAHTGADKRMRFAIAGDADIQPVLQRYVPPLAALATGRSRFQGQFVIKDGLESLQLGSSLQGVALQAPTPLGKAAGADMPLQILLKPAPARFGQAMRLDFELGPQLSGKLRLGANGGLETGALGLGRAAGEWPGNGMAVRIAQPSIKLDEWLAWQSALPAQGGDAMPTVLAEVETPLLQLGGFSLHQVSAALNNRQQADAWALKLNSREAEGEGSYQAADGGLVQANLSRLALNWPLQDGKGGLGEVKMKTLPAMKVKVANLSLQGQAIGKLEMTARRDGDLWLMNPLRLDAGDGVLTGSIRADDAGAGNVEASFHLDVSNAGKLLARLGQGDVFRNGQGQLSGKLSWPGELGDLDAAKLSGDLDLDFRNGRFAKVDVGAARLLGVLSLQSLPRRIRLDFTDVFSDGFAFDTLKGEASAKNGVFRSDRVEMKSPAAEVTISGSVDLGKETQSLKVHVVPHLAESVALAAGAALLNPVVGIATLAAQKVLQDPVGKILSLDYAVSGSLKEPQVARINVGPPVNIKGKKP